MIITHAGLKINVEKEQAFLEEIRTLIEESRKEKGNISYTLMKDVEQDNAYTMVEIWESLDAVEEHGQSEHFKAFVEKAPNYLVAPLEVNSYEGHEVKR